VVKIKVVKLKTKKVVPYREAEGKIFPVKTDDEQKYWIELQSGKIIVVSEKDLEGFL